MFSHLKNMFTDIAFLQETHVRFNDQARLRKPWIGQVFHSNSNRGTARGTAILIHKRIEFVPHRVFAQPGGRYIIVS